MRKTNKFIFTCLIALILFTPIFINNVMAAHEKSVEHVEKATENTAKEMTEEHGEEASEQSHVASRIWPYYGKMVIFADIMLAFMLFSFIAPLAHFYIKGEKHH